MTTIATAQTAEPAAAIRFTAGFAALFFGLFFIWGVGFASSAMLHDAAHDTRHGYGFPCH